MADDALNLGKSAAAQKMLSKMGDNFPEQEKVMLSQKVVKVCLVFLFVRPVSTHCSKPQINKRGKEQERVLLLTDKAMLVLFVSLLPAVFNPLRPRPLRRFERT